MDGGSTLTHMAETGWQAIGRIAKARRDRLGLNQDELALYGGPKVATVGKFERAAQPSFPLRTQHQFEKALGWGRGSIEQFVAAWDAGDLDTTDWEHDLVFEDIPDLSTTVPPENDDPEIAAAIEAIRVVIRLIDSPHRDEAMRLALQAMTPLLDRDRTPTTTPRVSVVPDTVGDAIAADQDADPDLMAGEQEESETP